MARFGYCLPLSLVGACDYTVVLGTDCPPLRGVCVKVDAGRSSDDAANETSDADELSDAGESSDAYADEPPDADVEVDAEVDAQVDAQVDAEVDAGPALFPPFQNPSFELRDGASAGPLMALEMPSSIAPWYACRTGLSALNSARAGSGSISPTEGETFLSDTFPIVAVNINGLNQNFDPPLAAGQRYAFAVDVWSESALSGNLALEVASGSCIPPVALLARSKLLPDGGWQHICLEFTPPRDVASLVLMVTAPEEYLNIGARLYMDDISEADCP
jgi:hypothetical protein